MTKDLIVKEGPVTVIDTFAVNPEWVMDATNYAIVPAPQPDWKEVVPHDAEAGSRDRRINIQRPSATRPQPMQPTAGAVNQLLNEAADYFEKGGAWCQNAMGTDSQVCAVGALLMMESGDWDNVYNETQPYRHPVTTAAVDRLADHLGKTKAIPHFSSYEFQDWNFGAVSSWNDKEGMTKAEVVKLFRDAAKE